MEFFAIIGIATLFLLWLISGPVRARRHVGDEEAEAAIFKQLQPEAPPSSKDAWQWQGPQAFLLHHRLLGLAQVIIRPLQGGVELRLMSGQGRLFA